MANGKKDDAQASAEGQEMDMSVSFPNLGEEAEETTEASGPEDRLAALEERFQQQIEAQNAAFEQERGRWQNTIDQLIQRSAAPTPAAPQPNPPRQELDFSDLPDPVERPQEFKTALARRFDQALSQRVDSRLGEFSRQTETQQTRNQALDDMWNKFRTQHADLAEKEITLRGAVAAEQEALRQRGTDPVQGMLSDPDGFMAKVAGRMRNELGVTEQEPRGSEQETVAGRPATLKKPNRTGGLGGSSSTLNGRGKDSGGGGAGFLDQLKKSQLNDGLI